MINGSALEQIAHIENGFHSKFGVPFQSNVAPKVRGTIVFEEKYRDPQMLRGLEEFSHIWLIWGFSENRQTGWKTTVRPPRLGGNTRKGVFATRSPFRPNPLGLSSVQIERIEIHQILGSIIHVLGADLMNGTPIYDIKPYIAFTDSRPNALGGFSKDFESRHLKVVMCRDFGEYFPKNEMDNLENILACDPRPQYHNDSSRVYGMEYGGFEIKFRVEGDVLFVLEVVERI